MLVRAIFALVLALLSVQTTWAATCNSASVDTPLPKGTGVSKIEFWRPRSENSQMHAGIFLNETAKQSHDVYLENGHDYVAFNVTNNDLVNGVPGESIRTRAKGVVFRNGNPHDFADIDITTLMGKKVYLFWEYCKDEHPNTVVTLTLTQSKSKEDTKIVDYEEKDSESLSVEQKTLLRKNADLGIYICKNQKIPSGYVITAQSGSINCPGNIPNQWYVRTPGPFDVVCKVSPIPPKYAITGETGDINCPGLLPNQYFIQKS